jgi:hypothetical protein
MLVMKKLRPLVFNHQTGKRAYEKKMTGEKLTEREKRKAEIYFLNFVFTKEEFEESIEEIRRKRLRVNRELTQDEIEKIRQKILDKRKINPTQN